MDSGLLGKFACGYICPAQLLSPFFSLSLSLSLSLYPLSLPHLYLSFIFLVALFYLLMCFWLRNSYTYINEKVLNVASISDMWQAVIHITKLAALFINICVISSLEWIKKGHFFCLVSSHFSYIYIMLNYKVLVWGERWCTKKSHSMTLYL